MNMHLHRDLDVHFALARSNRIRRLASRAVPIRSRHQKVQDLHPSPCHNAHHDVATEIQTKHAKTIGSFTFVWYRG